MKTLKTIAAAIVIMFGASLLVPEYAAARPQVHKSQADVSEGSSKSTKVVKKKRKKKYARVKTNKVKPSNVVAVQKEEESCFLFVFCNNSNSVGNAFGLKPVDVAAKYDGYTAHKNRTELRAFLSKPFNTDVDPMHIAWCAAFVNAVLQKSGYDTTDSLMARSFLNYGKVARKPEEGDIVVLKRGRSSATGHVGFFLGYDETGQYVKVLGGNQGKMVTIAYYPTSRVLGYRKPVAA